METCKYKKDSVKVSKGAIQFFDTTYNTSVKDDESDGQLDMVIEEQALLRQKADMDSSKFQIKKFPAVLNPEIMPELESKPAEDDLEIKPSDSAINQKKNNESK